MRTPYISSIVAILLAAGPADAAWINAGSAPLEMALETIVPKPYRIEIDTPVPRNAIVSWEESDDWMATLQKIIAPYGLQAKHDLGRNVVVIRSAPRITRTSQGSPPSSNASQEMREVMLGSPSAAPTSKRWLIRKGERLSRAITTFAAENGWTVKWRSGVDWTVPTDIDMPLNDPIDAIDKIAHWLHEEGIAIQFYAYMTNRILIVQAMIHQEGEHE